MRIHNYIYSSTLHIMIIIGLVCFSSAFIFGQEEMQDTTVTLSFEELDDTKTIIATTINQYGLPIEDLELYFYVKRNFSLLPVGDGFNSTDEEGIIEVEFPNDLPGDVNGDVIIVTKLFDPDLYYVNP